MRHHISTILCAALLALAPLTARADDCTDFKALSGSWADLHEVLEKGMDAELTDEQAAMWTYGQDEIDALNTMDYAKMNAAKTDWIDRWNEIFGM